MLCAVLDTVTDPARRNNLMAPQPDVGFGVFRTPALRVALQSFPAVELGTQHLHRGINGWPCGNAGSDKLTTVLVWYVGDTHGLVGVVNG